MNIRDLEAKKAELQRQLIEAYTELGATALAAVEGDKIAEEKRPGIITRIRDLKGQIQELDAMKPVIAQREQAARDQQNTAQQAANRTAARETTQYVVNAAGMLQRAVEAFADAYKGMVAAETARRSAFHNAGLRDITVGSVDLMVAVEFARAEISHLSDTHMTGIGGDPNIPEAVTRVLKPILAVPDTAAPRSNQKKAP